MSRIDRPKDAAVAGILAGNALTLLAALIFDWGLVEVLWPFWIQSVVIGWYARKRVLRLGDLRVDGTRPASGPGQAHSGSPRLLANFFALHFGGFHVVYLVFLLAFTLSASPEGFIDVHHANTGETIAARVGRVSTLDGLVFAGLGWAFWRAHRASHAEHVAADLAGQPNIGTLMFLPYLRVIPMHLTLLLGVFLGGGTWAIALFVALKTLADVGMHRVEHRALQARIGMR